MDELDEKIIDIILNQGFQRAAKIAAQLGAVERTVHRRLSKLIRNEIITKIVRTNPILLGYKNWVTIGINLEPELQEEVALHFTKYSSVYFVAQSIGTYDMVISARFRSVDELIDFINSDLPSIRGIQNMEVFLLVWIRKYFNFIWPSQTNKNNNKQMPDEHANQDHYELNEVERKILDLMTAEGYLRAAELSSRLNVGAVTIGKYIRRMLDNKVFALEVMINPLHQEYDLVATIGVTVYQRSARDVLNEVATGNPNIMTDALCIGTFNIILIARFRNISSLNHFVNVQLKNVAGVKATECFIHTKRYKYSISQY
jgi:DNA-binding Lrp family transcriptional regulator